MTEQASRSLNISWFTGLSDIIHCITSFFLRHCLENKRLFLYCWASCLTGFKWIKFFSFKTLKTGGTKWTVSKFPTEMLMRYHTQLLQLLFGWFLCHLPHLAANFPKLHLNVVVGAGQKKMYALCIIQTIVYWLAELVFCMLSHFSKLSSSCYILSK